MNWFDYYDDSKIIYSIGDFIQKLNSIHTLEKKITDIENTNIQNFNNMIELYEDKSKINKIIESNSYKILSMELNIIKLLTKYILSNTDLKYNFIFSSLNLLLIFSTELQSRLKQKDIPSTNRYCKETNSIKRCSYKFCKYTHKCTYNYTNSDRVCYQDHYVHNMVCSDLRVLLLYIEDLKTEDGEHINRTKEFLVTINTISYVIEHMVNELNERTKLLKGSDPNIYHYTKKIHK